MDYTKVLSALNRVKGALEKKIDAVNTSVSGLPDTLDTQFTAVKNDIATVKTDVAGVKTDVAGVRGGVDTTLQGLTELLNKGVVKSVQRGVLQWAPDVDVYGKKVTVNFGQVNPSKTIVLLQQSHGKFGEFYGYVVQASLVSLSETSMKLNVSIFTTDTPDSSSPLYASWQVIEFY